MRATIRLADGSLVEGELVARGCWLPPTVNAAACAGAQVPWTYGTVDVQGMIVEPTPILPPASAACAAPLSAVWVGTR